MDNQSTQTQDNAQTQTQDTQTQTQTQTAPAFTWKERINPDLRNSPLTQKFSDDLAGFENQLKSHHELEKMLGHDKVPIPKDDKDTEALLLAMKDVAEAQGGIGKLAKKITVSREHLYDILSSKHNPRLDNWLEIISALGFRVKLERQEKKAGHSRIKAKSVASI